MLMGAGAETGVLPGATALQEARLCGGVLESQLGDPWKDGHPTGQERRSQSKCGWQHGQVAAHGTAGKLCVGHRHPECPSGCPGAVDLTSGRELPQVKPSLLACGSRAPRDRHSRASTPSFWVA